MIRVILIVLILISGIAPHLSAGENTGSHNTPFEATEGTKNLSVQYKNIGDEYITKDNYKAAAPYYMKALSLGREHFSLNERTRIAIYLSWAGKMQESLHELDLILREDPSNLNARIHHARVLSWSGFLDKAIYEADGILRDAPDNKDALLIKANAFRWKGLPQKALELYRSILQQEELFDARLGTTYAQLSAGDVKGAKESRKLLKPTYPYQDKELEELTLHMDRIVRPSFTPGYSYYHDSDENITNRYFSGIRFWAGNWQNDLTYRHTHAKDDSRRNHADDIFFRTYSKLSRVFGLGGGVGFTNMANGESDVYTTWHIKTDVSFLNGIAVIAVSRDAATDIAELIENKIRYTSTTISVNQKLTDRWGVAASYRYRDYSDDNSANEIQVSADFIVHSKNPFTKLGTRLMYLDFARQSRSGYFDPNDFISPQMFAALSFESPPWYGYLEPFFGYQAFNRYGESNNDMIGGGYGLLGIRLSKRFSLEVNAEGGNYAVDTAAGWNYYLLGCRILTFF